MKKSTGWLALGIAAALAYFKYNKMTPEEKENVKGKVRNAQKNIKDALPDELKKALGMKKKMPEDFVA